MNKTELLAPAGSFEIGMAALYSGCDAIYLALEAFGARAYAKNFTIEELDEIINIAHSLYKKIYVTVNTLIKNNELNAVYDFLDILYEKGVDAVICADIAVFMYVINNCPNMGAHISTQVGVKDLKDTKFFEKIGAERVVLAREDAFEDIKNIKENTNIELEIFIHGALCVSYSGGCLFSSLLSLRSGNRGRCSQNCRREYRIFENNIEIGKPAFYLSLKDLCVGENVNELVKIGIDSLKIEGRMKNISYVDNITKYYRQIIDNKTADKNKIEQIFHRQFTKGFIFGEDRKNIATITDASSVGKMIGKVIKKHNNKIFIRINSVLRKEERIRFEYNGESQYFTVGKMFDLKGKEETELEGDICLECNLNVSNNSTIYKMQDAKVNDVEIDSNLIGINVFISGSKGDKLTMTANVKDQYFTIESNQILTPSNNSPLTNDKIYKQLNKLIDTPFFIDDFVCEIEENLFLSISELNEMRRELVKNIYLQFHGYRFIPERKKLKLNETNLNQEFDIIAHVNTTEQYEACKEMGIKTIYFDNFSPYVNAKYQDIAEDEVLVANYGGLYHYENKKITTDYSFNVLNKDSVLHLLNLGVEHITLSYEMTFNEIKDLATDFYNSYETKAPLDMIIYGKTKLMTMKYCPLKKLGLCGKCKVNKYHLVDKLGRFLIQPRENCFVEIYNDLPLNLINEIHRLKNYITRFRLEFVDESKEEVIDIISNLKKVLENENNKFNLDKQTSGYLKRSIL